MATATTTTKHTPGPWQADRTTCLDGVMICNESVDIAMVLGPSEELDEQTLADARLIAAAPEMLEALEVISKYGCSCMSVDPDWHSARCFIPIAKAAIRGARAGEGKG